MRRPSRLRRAALALPVAIAAALGIATLTAPGASAHGSVTDPPTRNYGCWERWGNGDAWYNGSIQTQDPMCYQAFQTNPDDMWNWNGLYVNGLAGQFQANIPDGQLCSGGPKADPRYDFLDTPGNWVAKDEPTTFHLTLTDSAKHGADYLKIYVSKQGFDPTTQKLGWGDLDLVKTTGSYPTTGDYETDVTVPSTRTGRAIVYTIWQASHQDQTYFLCSDVNFGGSGGSPSPTTPTPTQTTPTPTQTTPTPTQTTPTPTQSTPSTGGACTASVKLVSSWQGGYQADVTVKAGSTALKSWKVKVGGATITQAWNGTLSGSDTISSASWNSAVAANGTTNAGFLGSGTPPSSFTATCTS